MFGNKTRIQRARDESAGTQTVTNALQLACLLLCVFAGESRAAGVDFSNPVNYPVAQAPYEVVVADFNGDGKPDLVVPSILGNSLSVFLGNGDGTFQPPVTYPIPSGSGPLATGDFNGDGKLDLLVTGSSSGTLGVLLGNGDGTFRSSGSFAVTGSPTTVALGDFDGDGKIDLAVGQIGSTAPQISILLGDGQGNFDPIISYSIPGSNLYSLIVADLDGDTRQDLAVVSGTEVGVFLGNGDGTFQPVRYLPPVTAGTSVSVGAGDFNGDGKLDLIVASWTACIALLCPLDAHLYVGNGDGTFQAPSLIAALKAYRGGPFIVADFNRDGNPDAVLDSLGEQGGTLTILTGNGDGTFQGPINLIVDLNPVSPVAADLNADSLPDLVVADANTLDGQTYNISVLMNTASVSTFTLSITVNGSGAGVVITHPGALLCAHSCSQTFASGTQVTLGDQPNSGSSFSGWNGACSGTASCSLVMNANSSVTATFNSTTPPDFSLTASGLTPPTVTAGQSATGTVTVTPIGSFSGTVTFSCLVQPSPSKAPSCAVAPSSSGNSVTVMTTAPSFARTTMSPSVWAFAVWIPLIGLALITIRRSPTDNRKFFNFLLCGVLLSGIALQSACGGNTQIKSLTGGTPPSTYNVTVTGISGSIQHSTMLTLTVR